MLSYRVAIGLVLDQAAERGQRGAGVARVRHWTTHAGRRLRPKVLDPARRHHFPFLDFVEIQPAIVVDDLLVTQRLLL
jgi:hypothetical protein